MDTSPDWQPLPVSVGGIAKYPQLDPETVSSAHHSSCPNALAFAGIVAGGALLLIAGGWYAGGNADPSQLEPHCQLDDGGPPQKSLRPVEG
jgi:hypothetical protein